MQITEDMVTPHHLLAAERWISKNGMPEEARPTGYAASNACSPGS